MSYEDDLKSINGIGPATAEDIMEVHPDEESLREALQDNLDEDDPAADFGEDLRDKFPAEEEGEPEEAEDEDESAPEEAAEDSEEEDEADSEEDADESEEDEPAEESEGADDEEPAPAEATEEEITVQVKNRRNNELYLVADKCSYKFNRQEVRDDIPESVLESDDFEEAVENGDIMVL